MESLAGRTALVVGGGTGVGRALVERIAASGAKVFAMARDGARLESMAREVGRDVRTIAADATQPEVAAKWVRELTPHLLVIAAGVRPTLGGVDEHSWESFSAAWNTDVKATFHFCQEALRAPLKPGSSVIIVSSGAAVAGSPLSGGYAGAKRMQWLLAGYLQGISDGRKLGIRFAAVLPRQLLVGTPIGEAAAKAYAAKAGITPEKFMERFEVPLTPAGVAENILRLASGEVSQGTAFGITGKGLEPL